MTEGPLRTPRLSLRRPEPGDEAFLRSLARNPQVRRYLGGIASPTAQDAAFADCLNPETGSAFWVAISEAGGRPIGLISLSPHVDGTDTELSYQFEPAVWGQGFATEAIQRVIDHAHDELCLPRIIAETQSANTASRRLLERVGMRVSHSLVRFGEAQTVYATVRQTA